MRHREAQHLAQYVGEVGLDPGRCGSAACALNLYALWKPRESQAFPHRILSKAGTITTGVKAVLRNTAWDNLALRLLILNSFLWLITNLARRWV